MTNQQIVLRKYSTARTRWRHGVCEVVDWFGNILASINRDDRPLSEIVDAAWEMAAQKVSEAA